MMYIDVFENLFIVAHFVLKKEMKKSFHTLYN